MYLLNNLPLLIALLEDLQKTFSSHDYKFGTKKRVAEHVTFTVCDSVDDCGEMIVLYASKV